MIINFRCTRELLTQTRRAVETQDSKREPRESRHLRYVTANCPKDHLRFGLACDWELVSANLAAYSKSDMICVCSRANRTFLCTGESDYSCCDIELQNIVRSPDGEGIGTLGVTPDQLGFGNQHRGWGAMPAPRYPRPYERFRR